MTVPTTLAIPTKAARLGTLAIEGAFAVAAAARALDLAGREVIHLELGQPDFPSPSHATAAGIRALEADDAKYTAPAGLPELRTALLGYVRGRGIPAELDNIVVTSAAKPMLQYALLATVNPGDEVLIPNIGFPIYPSAVRLAGGTEREYAIELKDGRWQVDFDAIERSITPRTRAIILNSPHNPTGWTATREEMERLGRMAEKHNIWVISDEIYSGLAYDYPDGASPSAAAVPGLLDRTVIIDGFSKRWSMTGWRLGFGVVPKALYEDFVALIINNTSCTPPFVQRGGLAAVEGSQDVVHALRKSLHERRDRFVAGLNSVPGMTCALPAGAFYALTDVRALLKKSGLTTQQFQSRLLQEFGVAGCPGTDFGAAGEGFVRFSFATAAPKLDRGIELLTKAAKELGG
ncbi:MAG: aminotransferase class I/II-fold pyridoxal phosphate-dependent enzyme [Gemmatimonadetes bacterium]|nr:aminotransferase class I/II-fold pyridoxal phosphate-dependent enzyme [Gemmatimonadota bacterium]